MVRGRAASRPPEDIFENIDIIADLEGHKPLGNNKQKLNQFQL